MHSEPLAELANMGTMEPSTAMQRARDPTDTLTLRAVVPSKDGGAIIGKGGSNVQHIREETGVKLVLTDAQPQLPERVMSITGTAEGVGRAMAMVASTLDQENMPNANQSNRATINLLAPSTQAGAIIGKSGMKVKEIRETSGAQVSITKEVLPNSTDRMATIVGPPEAIGVAVQLIAECFLENPARGHAMPYHPEARLESMGLAEQFNPMRPRLPDVPLPPPQSRSYDVGMWQGQGGGYSFYGPPQNTAQSLARGEATQIVPIPRNLVGAIIGRGGCRINEIRQMTGARISITQGQPEDMERQIVITGNAEDCQQAFYMISDRMQAARQYQDQSMM